ncbi:hypothetical protein V7968_38405 [Nocardia vulneris]|uniref:hypothetical protein n=1 Tax=Nocardia vulneris TaxID=1141657 RepID=UPI0030CD2854
MTMPIDNAQQVWDRLVQEKVVRVGHYDRDLVDQVRDALGIEAKAPFRTALAHVSGEAFILVLLQAIAPFARMMVELLDLCEKIHADHSDAPNLRIRFDFDANAAAVEFDLTAFRAETTRFRHVTRPRRTRIWNQDALFGIHGAVDRLVDRLGLIGARSSRLPGHEVLEGWPSLAAPPPVSGLPILDQALAALWRVRADFVADASTRWPDRHGEQFRADMAAHTLDDPIRSLWGPVSDFWDHSFGANVAEIARAVNAADSPLSEESLSEITDFVRIIDNLLAALPVVEHFVEQELRELVELLSLPMWGKRHELYAAWVFPRIVAAIGFDRLRFHVPDGLMSFAFKGVHLATFDTVDGFAQVWAELRTAYDASATGVGLLGKSRSQNVQPDYSVTFEPKDGSEEKFLVVECKQYLRAAPDHAKALHDYTIALPNATVVLAQYGPVSGNVLGRVDPASRTRAHAVSHFRPDRAPELETFERIVSAVIPAAPALVRPVPDIGAKPCVFDRKGAVRIELTWEAAEVDLDLHALFADGTHVWYRSPYEPVPRGWARLVKDIRRPPGPEVLLLDGDQRIDIVVHGFNQAPVGRVGAQLKMISDHNPHGDFLVLPTTSSDARWFHACTVLWNRIEVVSRFYDSVPWREE